MSCNLGYQTLFIKVHTVADLRLASAANSLTTCRFFTLSAIDRIWHTAISGCIIVMI